MTKGFTLVELIIVIVILGVLAAVAAPRFINLSSDAQISRLQQLKADLTSSARIIKSKAVLQQIDSASGTLDEGNFTITLYEGYPVASWQNAIRFMINKDTQEFTVASTAVITPCDSDYCGFGRSVSNFDPSVMENPLTIDRRIVHVWPRGYTVDQFCALHYIKNSDDLPPIITLSTSGC